MAEEKIVLDEQLLDYLRTYVRDLNLKDPEFYITKACNKGDNFVGLVYRVKIEGIENGKAKSVHVILKTPRLDTSTDVTQSINLYEREIFFYQEILPIFKETLKKHGGIADLFPTFYGANNEPGKEILILENLMVKGFTMKSLRIMDYPHVSLALRCLGEFHAYSFITRAADPISFNKLKEMKEPLFSRILNYERDEYIINVCNIIGKALIDEKKYYLERYQQFTDNIRRNMNDVIDGNAAEPYAVVNHGDAWTNNILYKYDQKSQERSQEKKPCDLRFLDFQICRYASPVLDIVYLLFCCCTQETRSKYYDQLIDEYYETLSKCLERCGYDSNILFPYEVLSKHFTKFGKYAAGMAIFTLHIFTDNKGEYTDIESTRNYKKMEERVQNDSFYRYMIKGTFKDLVDKNYI
ncbi:PREDICTED: uncharacterized protein LOC106751483 [Dinoponera quadriceps]|uniref:Uncharacterized protein LOC106751483 n=1 Tax=Dinoponera quadriceps TaxID=609295 RepID=A0A6P3YD75_DINQU|nr:PREDICTED: uncharacterized protein LOC106751483 [Dinoponera quadriceps]